MKPLDEPLKSILLRSFKKAHVIGMFVPSVGLLALKDQTTKLGAPNIDEYLPRRCRRATFFDWIKHAMHVTAMKVSDRHAANDRQNVRAQLAGYLVSTA